MPSQLIHLRAFLNFVVLRFKQDKCPQIAASLTFTTLLSLVPLITIGLMLFSAFPVFDEFSQHIKNFLLSNMVPETGGKMISRYMEQFAESASRLKTVGIVFLAVTAMLMLLTIDNAFNTIWRVSRPRTVLQRVLTYWAVLTLAPLLVGGSLTLTSWLVGMSAGYARQIPAVGVGALKIVPVLLTTFAFSLLFRIVPNRYVPLKHALIGGVVAAMAFESMNQMFGFYITNFPTYKLVYGAFASIPIFLLWVYLSWLTIILGAVITASLPHWRGDAVQKISAATALYYALRVLKLMHAGLQSGEVQTIPLLSKRLHISFDTLESLLGQMAQAGMVGKLAGQGWALVRDVEHIGVQELYRVFVFDSAQLPNSQDTEICAYLQQMDKQMAQGNQGTLGNLVQP